MRNSMIPVIVCIFLFLAVQPVQADLTINLVAVNATENPKKVPVKYNLPEELEPDDVVDTGPLKLDYDVNKGTYTVSGEFEFQPKESKTYKVVVKDVWKIDPDEIELLKTQLIENLTLLEGADYYDDAVGAKDLITARLDFILAQQNKYSQDIGRRIEEYRAYVKELEDIRKKIFSLDSLQAEAKSLDDVERDKTVKLLIEVQNPSKTESKVVKQKHILPKEIREEHVVDSKGFDVRFDNDKEAAYLAKEDEFKPAETKKYEIEIKDVWQFPISKTDALLSRAQTAFDEIAESTFVDSGKYIFDAIKAKLGEIRDTQQQNLSIKEHIGVYRVNIKRFERAEDDVQKLEQMLAIVRAKKLEDFEKGKVKNILQKMQALKGLAQLSEAIFKKGISVTMTWRIITGTLIFISFFTTWHFFLWAKRSKQQGEESGVAPGETMKEVPKPGEEAQEETAAA